MATESSTATRTSEFFRLLDAKDVAALRATFADDPQGTDEMTRGWLRGRPALEAYFTDNLPHMTDIHSTLDDVAVRAWGDVEVAPTTLLWRREGDAWKLALVHSIPLSTAP
jgi:ketosteroid isomerase-like protein